MAEERQLPSEPTEAKPTRRAYTPPLAEFVPLQVEERLALCAKGTTTLDCAGFANAS